MNELIKTHVLKQQPFACLRPHFSRDLSGCGGPLLAIQNLLEVRLSRPQTHQPFTCSGFTMGNRRRSGAG
jgi:hypothetical protein